MSGFNRDRDDENETNTMEHLRSIREWLIISRRKMALDAAKKLSIDSIDALIELQKRIETIDLMISDEIMATDLETWKSMRSLM